MLVVDVVIVAILVVALDRRACGEGCSRASACSSGSVLGGLAAFWLVPLVNDVWPWQSTRVVAVIALVLVLVIGGAAAGGAIGAALRRGVDRSTPLRVVDRILGGALAVLAGALSLVSSRSSVAQTGTPVIATALSSSQVLRTIEALTPRPVAETLARVRVRGPGRRTPAARACCWTSTSQPTAPPVALDDPELAAGRGIRRSRLGGRVRVRHRVRPARGSSIAPDRVVTNAHVVAGVDGARSSSCRVSRRARGASSTSIPIDDLAVIAVDDLGAAAARRSCRRSAPGTAAVVQGYPYGGPFTSVPAPR